MNVTTLTPAEGAPNWWGLLCIPLVVVTAAGNILVCVAISSERRLQNMTNYFLMSLAITDLMVAVLVMPLGIVVLVLGRFPLPPIYCMLWTLLDVLFCTASIMHLCTLSVDRYLSLSFPMRFGRHKTRRRVLLKLVPVWLLSVSQSVPLCLIYARDHQAVLVDGVCAVPEPLFQLVGSVVCFYIPLLVMLVTYALTVRMLQRKQAELGSPLRMAPPPPQVAAPSLGPLSTLWWRKLLGRLNPKYPIEEMECTDFSVCATNSAYASLAGSPHLAVRCVRDDGDRYGTFPARPPASPEVSRGRRGSAGELASPAAAPWSEAARRRGLSRSEQRLSSATSPALLRPRSAGSPGSSDSVQSLHYQALNSPGSPPAAEAARPALVTSLTADGGAVTAVSNGDTLPVPLLPPLRRSSSAPKERSLLVRLHSTRGLGQLQRGSGPLRATCRAGSRPNLRAEQKATKVLGIIFFTFVLLWSPFFIINMVLPLCEPCRYFITIDVINFVTWLGYISSLVNPIFYTLFNKTFRNAFLRILRCRRSGTAC